MRVVLSTPGKFHTFDLARELHARNMLASVFTGYPIFKLKEEGLPLNLIKSWPWIQSAYMAMPKREWLGTRVLREWEWRTKTSLDRVVSRRMPECDIFVGLSGSALNSGLAAQRLGARYVCDRGSAHIRVQDGILREESQRWSMSFRGIDPRVIAREEAEYEAADCITVPSSFSIRSFIEQGLSESKLALLPYGVNLTRFTKTAEPMADRFDVLYVGGMNLNKGIPYLLQAFQQFDHPHKSLTFAGAPSRELIDQMRAHGLWSDQFLVLGHVPQPELQDLMSRSHAMVLASVQEGFGMVLSQAMACGCVVIASENTGGQDLFTHGQEGFIVPPRDGRAIRDWLQLLADDPLRRQAMSMAAIMRVRQTGGWHDYGESACALYRSLRGH